MPNELLDPARESDSEYQRLRALTQTWRGVPGRGIALRNTSVADAGNYAGDFANTGTGTKALRGVAGSHSFTVDSSGISLSSATIAGNFLVGGNLTVNGNSALGNTATDATTILGALTQSGGAISLSSPTTATIAATGAGVLTATSWTISGPTTVATSLTSAGTLTAQANGVFRNGATGAITAFFDVTNTRLLVGTSTNLTGASNDLFSVIGGRAYVAAGNEDAALGLRYNSSTAGTVYLGASNSATSPALIVKGHNGTEVAAFNVSTATTAQLAVTGSVSASTKLVVGATAWSATEAFRVVGASLFGGTVAVTGANVTLENNRLLQGNDGSTLRNLAKYDSGGVAQYGESGSTGNVVDGGYVQLKYNGTVRFEINSTGIGAFGASPIAKPTVVGAKGGNAALGSLMTALSGLGWVTDLTTA